MGRPSEYSDEIAEAICEALVEGRSLRSICAAADMPAASTVFRWLAANEAFRDRYARAREAQADALFDEILDIADDGAKDYVVDRDSDGSEHKRVDHEHISRAKLRVDARKWMASKLLPKKYGDRVELDGGLTLRHEDILDELE